MTGEFYTVKFIKLPQDPDTARWLLGRYRVETGAGDLIGFVSKQRHRQQYVGYKGRGVSHHTCWSVDGRMNEGCFDTRQDAVLAALDMLHEQREAN